MFRLPLNKMERTLSATAATTPHDSPYLTPGDIVTIDGISGGPLQVAATCESTTTCTSM